MTRFCYLFLFTFAAVFGEVLAESFGVRIMLLAPVVFYAAYVFGSASGTAVAFFGGCVLDFCLGATNPWTAFFLLLIVAFAIIWLHQTEADSLSLLIVPGAILPFLAQFPPAIIQGGFRWESILDAGADAVIAAILSALLFPVAIMVLDWIGAGLSLELFADTRERLRSRQRRS